MVLRTIVIAIYLASSSLHAEILNRNLLEVNYVSYSQRNFELYILAKEALFLRKDISPNLVSAGNWKNLLESYKNEMLIDGLFSREEHRLITFLPNGDMVDEAYRIFKKSLSRSKVLKNKYSQFKGSEEELKTQLIVLLKVQNYLKSKVIKNKRNNPFYSIDTNAPWFVELSKNSQYRFFDDASNYKKMQVL